MPNVSKISGSAFQ